MKTEAATIYGGGSSRINEIYKLTQDVLTAETGLPAEARRSSWTPWPRGQANPAPGPGPRTCTTHGGPVPTDRRRLIFRGNAANTNCSPRYLNANNRPSNSNVNIGCSAQGWISFSVELWTVPVPERGAHPRQGPGGKCRMGAARLRRALCQDLAGNITIGDGDPSPFSIS